MLPKMLLRKEPYKKTMLNLPKARFQVNYLVHN